MPRPTHQFLLFISTSLLLTFVTACGHDNSPEGVAEEFLFRYFIELNQRGARELSTGLATNKLNKEIELLQSVRMEPNLDLSKHKPFIDYKLVSSEARNDATFILYYDVIIKGKDGSASTRQQVLSLTNLEGKWRVNNFDTFTPKTP